MSSDLAIITNKFRLSAKQYKALKARMKTVTHADAARSMCRFENPKDAEKWDKAFRMRIARAIAALTFEARNEVLAMFPRRVNRRERVRPASLDATMGNV